MKDFKKFLSAKSIMLLMVMVFGAMLCTSCGSDDDKGKDEPSTSNELVGTWYFTDDEGTDYNDYFIFRSNGTGLYHYDADETDEFTYTYDSKSCVLLLNYKNWDNERLGLVWLNKNYVDFGGDYGTYARK